MNASQLHAVNPFPGKYMAISRRKAFILLNEFTSSLQHQNQWVAQQRLKRQCFSEQEPYYLCLPVSTNKTFEYMSDIRIWKFKKIKDVFKEDNAIIKLLLGVPNQSVPIWATEVLDE